MILKNNRWLFVVGGMLVTSGMVHAGSFLIKKKVVADEEAGSWSRTRLQEELGDQVKEVFRISVAITHEVGCLQVSVAVAKQAVDTLTDVLQKNGQILQELSSLQRLCSRVLEALVDDHIVFKKSPKKELEALYDCMQSCSDELTRQHKALKKITTTTPPAGKLAAAMDDASLITPLTACLAALTQQKAVLTHDYCVKKL